jgi:putative ABC transport system permease protein
MICSRSFPALAMLISCLGLWGLVAFAAEQRVKEIGIRKVLGASVPNLVGLLTKDFIILVVISIVIASPLAYWGMHSWLKEFAFRIDIGWTVFVVAATGCFVDCCINS